MNVTIQKKIEFNGLLVYFHAIYKLHSGFTVIFVGFVVYLW